MPKADPQDRRPVIAHRNYHKHADNMQNQPMDKVFNYIYAHNIWGAETSRSGLGSELSATSQLQQDIVSILRKYRVNTLLDAPCGDFGWLNQEPLPLKTYIGIDIVAFLIEDHKEKYIEKKQGQPGLSYQFYCQDISTSPIPRADLILCRDCLVHLPFETIHRILKNLKSSGAKYFLATTFPEVAFNRDIEIGDWRPLNLEKEPFNFPPTITLINEACDEEDGDYADKSLALWKFDDLMEF